MDTNVVIASGTTTSGSLTMPDADVACVFTNTRKQASLRLEKTWSGAELNDTTTLAADGPQVVPTFVSTANTAAETDTGPTTAVSIGDVYTLSETLGSSNLGFYGASDWSCSGGTLVGNTLTIPSAAAGTTITCSITNTKQPVSLGLEKTASPATYTAAGQTIDYSYVLTNTGSVTLFSPYQVTDDKTTVTCPTTPASLAPNASVTCTATYTITQADLDAGSVTNTATAEALDVNARTITSAPDQATVTATRTASLTLDKQAGTPSGNTAGSTIAYSFVVTNTGNTTLTNVAVSDAKVGSVTCPGTTLAPGATMTCTATYSITQADVNAGTVDNTATVTGTPPRA